MSGRVKSVCFVSSRSAFISNTGEVWIDWANGRLINEIFSNSDYKFSLAIFSDPKLNSNYDYKLNPLVLYKLPFPMSYYHGLKNSLKIHSILRRLDSENDILIVQLPIISFIPLLFLRKPVIYHVCANVLTAANNRFKYRGFSLIIARSFAALMNATHRYLFRKKINKVIVNGNELGALYQKFNPKIAVSSSVYGGEIALSNDIPVRESKDEFNLLFIGRPSKEKGIEVLLESFDLLQSRYPMIRLHMIGVKKEELLGGLLKKMVNPDSLGKVTCHGFVPWGDTFKSIVKKSHVLIMCSVSEGTPRVIIESRALGCPVIATNIGGVSSSVRNGITGILVPVGNSEAIVNAVIDLMSSENYRQQLIHNGLEAATEFTIDTFANNFTSSIEFVQ